jgi:hypothetical protein
MEAKYLELESLHDNWIGTIFLKVIKETKNYYFTIQNPYLGIISNNYKDREKNIIRWDKNKYDNNGMKIRNVTFHIPSNANRNKIYG